MARNAKTPGMIFLDKDYDETWTNAKNVWVRAMKLFLN